jgi:hypothetical protein
MRRVNRIDPLAAPSTPPAPPAPRPPRWYESAWFRNLALATVGATLAGLCQLAPWPVVRVACVAVSSVLSKVEFPASGATDGGL